MMDTRWARSLLEAVTPAAGAVGWVAVVLGGGAFLWFVSLRSGPQVGEVVVHVLEGGVTLTVAGESVAVERPEGDPPAFELPLGEYELILSRGGVVLDRQAFRVLAGETVVLMTWDRSRAPPGSAGPRRRGDDDGPPPDPGDGPDEDRAGADQ